MSILGIAVGTEVVKQLFKFGGSWRKESIIGAGVAPAVTIFIQQYQECGALSCVSAEAYGVLIGRVMIINNVLMLN